ncbi:hypothetical protein K3495_g5882 [Podosphaera aphanis]|nr:hypothetical protein K3495_g5882 [Podosphaera aphanis]
MGMKAFNFSATLNLFRLVDQPNLCLPHASISTFNQLPVPLKKEFFGEQNGHNDEIRAIVLDKDNCFAMPHSNSVYKSYEKKFMQLKAAYPGRRLLVVSNTAGASSYDTSGRLASEVETATGVNVLSHVTKKPGCGREIMAYFRHHPETGVTRPDQIAVIGDRLMTDVMLANLMGSYAIWVREGVVPAHQTSILAHLEQKFARFLLQKNYKAPTP